MDSDILTLVNQWAEEKRSTSLAFGSAVFVMMSRVSDAHEPTLSSVASDDRNDLEIIISDGRAEDQIKFLPRNWHPNIIIYETVVQLDHPCR